MSDELNKEIAKLKADNKKLTADNTDLNGKIEMAKNTISKLKGTVHDLDKLEKREINPMDANTTTVDDLIKNKKIKVAGEKVEPKKKNA